MRSIIQDGCDDWPLSEARGHYILGGADYGHAYNKRDNQ